MKPKYFGVLNGTNFAASGIHDRAAVLLIDSKAHAREVLKAADSGQRYATVSTMVNLDGKYPGDIPGGIGEGAILTLWAIPATFQERQGTGPANFPEVWECLTESGDLYPDHVVEFGPRGGVRVVNA